MTVLAPSWYAKPIRGPRLSQCSLPRRARVAVLSRVLELLGGEVEHRALVVGLGGGEVEGVAQAGVHREARRGTPVVLNERLEHGGALAELGVLEIDGEILDLPQQEAGQGQAGPRLPGEVAPLAREPEEAGGGGGLDDVQALVAEVHPRLEGVPAPLPRHRVHELRHAGG